MKKISRFLLISIFVIGALSSCKKDDKVDSNQLIGKWTFVKVEYNEHVDGEDDKYEEEANEGDFIEFKSNGTYAGSNNDELFSGTWELEGKKLTLYESGLSSEAEIKKLTSSSLIFYIKELDEDDPGDYYETTVHLKK